MVIDEWTVPVGSRPHDPAVASDGSIWYTGNTARLIGRLDPTTGDVREFAMPDARARDPHTPVLDAAGTVWFTVQGGNLVGRLVPATGEITLVASRTPGFLGRLDPRTGEVTEFASPGGRTSQPYGMTSTNDGAIWYSESGVEPNTVVRFDPSDGSMQRWPIPSGGGVVRHMVTAPNGDVWMACSGVDRMARVRIAGRAGGAGQNLRPRLPLLP